MEYAEALEMADRHVLFKQAIKEIAHREGKSASFMPKFAEEEAGNGCHIHLSLQQGQEPLLGFKEKSAFAGLSSIPRGPLKYSPELCLFCTDHQCL